MDRFLPGMSPELVRITLVRRQDGSIDVNVLQASDVRYIKRADAYDVEGLSYAEATDVVAAVLDSLDGG